MSANKGTKRSADPLLLRVMREIHRTAETPDKGFRTVDQGAAHWGLGRSRARDYVLKAIELGLMEERKYRVNIKADSKPYPVSHYREKTRPRKS